VLPDLDQEDEPSRLEPEVLYLERIQRDVFWQTLAGPILCPTTFDHTLQLYPELCHINRNQAVPLRRFRKIEPGPKEDCTLTLDHGTRLVITRPRHPHTAEALGCDKILAINAQD